MMDLSQNIKRGIRGYLNDCFKNNWMRNCGLPTLRKYIENSFLNRYQNVNVRIINQSLVVSNITQKSRVTPPARISKKTLIKDFTITPLKKKVR